MKFCYTDECGNNQYNKVITMTGVSLDYTKVNKHKKIFENLRKILFDRYYEKNNKFPCEIKTHQLYEGKNDWSKLDPEIRKKFILESCQLSSSIPCDIFMSVIDFKKFKSNKSTLKKQLSGHWQWLATHIILQIQYMNFREKNNKGNSLVVFDEHHGDLPTLVESLSKNVGIHNYYKVQVKRTKKTLKKNEHLNQIIELLAVDSVNSSFNQLADVYAYVTRRYVELAMGSPELYSGDKSFITKCFNELKKHIFFREKAWKSIDETNSFFRSIAPDDYKKIIKGSSI